jgi:hypothetical protein
MEKPTFITVPASLRNKDYRILNISTDQWTIYMIFAGVIVFLLLLVAASSGILQAFLTVLLLGSIAIFYKFFRKESVVANSKLIYGYLFRKYTNEQEFSKYRESDLQKIKNSLSIVKVHENGLIQFDMNHYASLLRYAPPTVNGEKLWPYVMQTLSIVDSLLPNMLVKIFVVSVGSDPIKFKREILESSGMQKSKQAKEHLLSIYKMLEEKKDRAPEWNFYMLVDFGKYNSLEEAVISAQNYYPGFEERLKQVGIMSRKLTAEPEILISMRNAINPLKPAMEEIK